MRFSIRILFITFLISQSAAASENRCGWIDNPTPGNWWLTDKDGEWLINSQGMFQIDDQSMQHLNPSPKEYIKTNGNYGYYCACLTVDVDKDKKRILKIYKSKQLPIAKCRNDAALDKC